MQWEVGKPDKPLVEFGSIVEEGCGAPMSSKEHGKQKNKTRESRINVSSRRLHQSAMVNRRHPHPQERHPPCNLSKHNRLERAYVHLCVDRKIRIAEHS